MAVAPPAVAPGPAVGAQSRKRPLPPLTETSNPGLQCFFCCTFEANVAFAPCGHTACIQCTRKLMHDARQKVGGSTATSFSSSSVSSTGAFPCPMRCGVVKGFLALKRC